MDGPYKGLSNELLSPADNYEVLYNASKDMDVVVLPGQIWESEAKKRTYTARAAGEMFPRSDRLLVIDGDEQLLSDIPQGCPVVGVWKLGPTTNKMIRVYELTPTITWGPQHWHITDGQRKYHETPEEVFDTYPTFEMYHNLQEKRIQEEYDRYNVDMRPSVEFDRNKVSAGDVNRMFGDERLIIGKATTGEDTPA